jgi:hypothetical protein
LWAAVPAGKFEIAIVPHKGASIWLNIVALATIMNYKRPDSSLPGLHNFIKLIGCG